MAFRKFCRTQFTDEAETSLHFTAKFNTVVTNAVDSFKFTLGKLKDEQRYIGENEAEIRKDVHL